MRTFTLMTLSAVLAGCATSPHVSGQRTDRISRTKPASSSSGVGSPSSPQRPSAENMQKIGRRVWMNECGGTVAGLTSWGKYEDFPSFGIGHFIWFPANVNPPFDESFPRLIAYMRERGVRNIPSVALNRHCPWNSPAEFESQRNSAEMVELRNFLAQTTGVQADFLFHRLTLALPKMKRNAAGNDPGRIESNFHRVASTPEGVFALVDYVNFKGEGTKPEERYRGQGWGLLWVLSEMRDTRGGMESVHEFSESAKRVLNRRIENAPRDESQWRAGWSNRCESYKRRF